MEIKATAKYIKISPKKVRLVADLVRKTPLQEALDYLSFSSQRAARPVLKIINSALANAEHNFGLKRKDLYIKKLLINQGPALKRWTAKARGMAAQIKRQSSHITVVLGVKIEPKIIPKEKAKLEKEKIITPLPISVVQSVDAQKVQTKKMEKVMREAKPEIFDRTRVAAGRRKQHLDKIRLKKTGGTLKRIFKRKTI